jgi:hypothetical protein
MAHRQDAYFVAVSLMNDPVGMHEDLAYVVPAVFRNYRSRFREHFQLCHAVKYSINDYDRILTGVSRNMVLN